MELSASDIDRNMRQFVRMALRVLQNAANKGHNEYRKQARTLTFFSEMPESDLHKLHTDDRYFQCDTVFDVLGLKIVVQDRLLADTLQQLSEHRRNIILLKYFQHWTDKKIGEALATERATIQYQRQSALKQLERMMKEKQ